MADNNIKIGIEAELRNYEKIVKTIKEGIDNALVDGVSDSALQKIVNRIKTATEQLNLGNFKAALDTLEKIGTGLLTISESINVAAGAGSSELVELNKQLKIAKDLKTELERQNPKGRYRELEENGKPTGQYVRAKAGLQRELVGITSDEQWKQGKATFDNVSVDYGGKTWSVNSAINALVKALNDGAITLNNKLKSAFGEFGYSVKHENGIYSANRLDLTAEHNAAVHTWENNVAQAEAKVKDVELQIEEASAVVEKIQVTAETGTFVSPIKEVVSNQQTVNNLQEEYNKTLQAEAKAQTQRSNAAETARDAQDKLTQSTEKQTSAVGKAVTTFFGYQMVIRQLRKLWNEAIRTITELDKQLTNQAIVTDLTREQTWKLVTTYQELADQAGVTQTEIAAVTTEYLRQGETLDNALALTKAATAAATVAGISASDSVRYLTTAIHGFKLEAEDALAVSDKFAALAAQAATNYEDLAVALSKVASQAALAGMSMDYTLALLTTGLDVTQEAPESIGTALKTVIARMREISDYGKTLEGDVDLNQVEAGLRAVGIQLRNGIGELRSTEDVLDELGRKWQDLSANQQAAVAKALAGTRQQSRLVAIMENYDDVLQNMAVSQNSLGATTAQQVKYLQGMEAAMNRLQNAYQSLIETIVKSDEVISVVNILANTLKQVRTFLSQPLGRTTFIMGILTLLSKSQPLLNKIKSNLRESLFYAQERRKEEERINQELLERKQLGQSLSAEEEKQLADYKFNKKFDKISGGIGKALSIGTAVMTVINWVQEAIEVYKNRYKEAAENAIDKASEIQSEVYNNTQTMTNLQNLSESLLKLDKQVVKSAETMSKLADTRSELLKDLEISDAEAKLYTNQQLYDKAMAKRAQLENKNNELLSQLGDTLLGAANNYDAGAGALNILTKIAAGAGIGGLALAETGPGAIAGAVIGGVVGAAVGAFEEISKGIASNDAKGKVHEMLQNDEGILQLRYYFKAVYKNDIDTTTAAGEQLAASVKTTYASLMDTLSGGQIEELLNKYNWDANAMSSAVTSILIESSEALTTLTKDTSNYTERVKAASEIYAKLNEESKELGDAFLQQYGSYVQLGVILGENVQYMDKFKWSMTAMNELLSQLADDNKTVEEMADIIKTLGEAMEDNTLSAEELEAALGNMSHAAREAAAELISSFTMQDIADQFTTAKNAVNTIRETQSKWGNMSATERQRFIDDNEDFFNIPGAREAFYNGGDITQYIEQYKKSIQDGLIKTVNDKAAALQIELYDLEKQLKEAELAGNTDQVELLNKQITTINRSLEDLRDTYSDVNSMFNLTLSEVVSKQNEQISKLKEMYQAEEKALTDSLNKRKEAYQKYFDGLAKAESLDEYNQSREDLVNAIAKVGAGTDATSRRKVADLQRQLQELDKQESQRQKEEARQAVLENIDNEISRIQEQFDKLLQSDQALLDSMNENTYLQYLTYLAQSGQTTEARELAIQQMGDLLKGKWGVSGNRLFGDIATETTSPSISDVQVDTASNNFTVVNSAGIEQQVQLTEAQMRQLVVQLLDTVKRWTGLSWGN